MEKTKRENYITFGGIVVIFLLLLLFNSTIKTIDGDDKWFTNIHNSYSFVDYIHMRYFTWSGRVVPDTILYFIFNNVTLWRMVNSLALLLTIYSIVRIVKGSIKVHEIVLPLLVIGYLDKNLLYSGIFWITGSINYIWPISLILFGMIPYADRVFRNKVQERRSIFILDIIAIIIASLSNEQVMACAIGAALAAHISLIYKKEKQDKRLILMTALMFIGALILVLAPGNSVRNVQEEARWYPGFSNMSLISHIHVGIIWMYNGFFNIMRMPIMLLSIIIIISFYSDENSKKNFILKVFIILTLIPIVFSLSNMRTINLLDFKAIESYNVTRELLNIFSSNLKFIVAIGTYVFWTLYMIVLVYLLILNNKNKVFISLCLLAMIISMVIIFFTPTIYASGERVFTVPGIFLSLIIVHSVLTFDLLRDKVVLFAIAILPLVTVIGTRIKFLIQ